MKTFIEMACFTIGIGYLGALLGIVLLAGWEGVRAIPDWVTLIAGIAMLALFIV